MSNAIRGVSVCVGLAIATSGLAQTPDGQTPRAETGCDALEGSAYGLCVAWCEATDAAHPSADRLRALLDRALPRETDVVCDSKGNIDGTLTIGALVPESGALAFFGPAGLAAIQLAVRDVNEAGGVLGREVVLLEADSGADARKAARATKELIDGRADVVVGAWSSGISYAVIDQITEAGLVQISPANTSTGFTDYDDGGLYFRTAPSDAKQGVVLADLAAEAGTLSVGILALDEDYGEALSRAAANRLTERGGKSTIVRYPYMADSYATEVATIAKAEVDAVMVIGFDETALVVKEMIARGVGPADLPVFFVDGNLGDYADSLPKESLIGVKGTIGGGPVSEDFAKRLREIDPTLEDLYFAPEAYDAVVVAALAARVARSDAGKEIAAALAGVSKGGVKCTSYKACVGRLEKGEDIDYDGRSGPIEFDDAGDPGQAWFSIWKYDETNTPSLLEYRLSGE